MTGGGIDRRGPKDSENAHNSFLTKCTEKGFWIFATDMDVSLNYHTRRRWAIAFNLNTPNSIYAMTKILLYSENLGYL